MAIRSGSKPDIQQGFVDTIEELAVALEQIDSRRWNAFFGCASFDPAKLAEVERRTAAGETQPNGKPLKMRSHENALAAQSFWLDLDAGPKKPYANAEAAIEALDEFCWAVNLPIPTVIESGNGIHAWWTMDQPIPAATWNRAAAALKALTKSHGLHADPTRTADISSILRAPGTSNWKDAANPKEVRCDEFQAVTSAQSFFLQLAGQAPSAAPSSPATVDLGAAMTNVPKPPSEPSYAAVAVQHCQQLQHFRDTRGNIEEPLWYANLGVLAHCADGETLAQEWSNGHPGYSERATAAKLEQARVAAGPTTCAKFADLNLAGCQGCPYRVSSPIVLGRGQSINVPEVDHLGNKRPELPWGFRWGHHMELLADPPPTKAGDAPELPHIVSQYAVYLSGLRTSENRADGRGYVFQQWFPHEGWVQFEMTAAEFMGSSGRQIMGQHGCLIHPNQWNRFVNYVHRAAVMLRGQATDDKRYDQFGWKDDYQKFVIGSITYKCDGTKERAAGSKEVEKRAKLMEPPKTGSLAKWTEAADRLFMPGCEAQAFTLLCSFAAPLMPFVSGDEGGAILSMYSAGSGTGKTTALDAAVSVWGQLDSLRLISMDTQVAKFRSIATLCNLPVVFDEMFSKDPSVVQDFVRCFTTGRDKKRGQRDGSVDHIDNKWQTILITASNQSLIDNLATGGSDPQAARIFELEMRLPPGLKSSSTKELSDAFMANRGYAGLAYAEQIVRPGTLLWIKDALPKVMHHYETMLRATSEHRFIIRELACVAVAAHIVQKAGILHFDVNRIMDWAIAQAKERIRDRVSFNAVDAFKFIINAHSQDCIVVADRYNPRTPTTVKKQPQRGLLMRCELKPQRLYIPADIIRKLLTEANKPYGAVLRELTTEGILINEKTMRSLGAGTDYMTAQVPCWEIDLGHPQMSGEMRLVEDAAATAAHEK